MPLCTAPFAASLPAISRSDLEGSLVTQPTPATGDSRRNAAARRETVMFLNRHGLGHRTDYLTLFSELLRREGYRSFSHKSLLQAILHPGPVIIMMVEDYRWGTYLVGLARACLFRRTLGLLFLARETLLGTRIRHVIKRALLRLARVQSRFAVVTIVPHAVLRQAIPDTRYDIGRLTHGWIDDPQLWDLEFLPNQPLSTPLSERVVTAAGERAILMVSGGLSRLKGLEMIGQLAADEEFGRSVLLVVAGELVGTAADFAEVLQDSECFFENRFLSNDELRSLYSISDLVWCAYRPDFDQASGIFGRAVQTGVTPIVRKGSIVEAYGQSMSVPMLSVEWQDPEIGRSITAQFAHRDRTALAVQPTARRADDNVRRILRKLFDRPLGNAVSPREPRDEMVRS